MTAANNEEKLKIYSYYRSSAAYRVRIALNLKKLNYEIIPVNLLEDEQNSGEYKTLNPQGLVPLLSINAQANLSQSLAILEWLEESYPSPALLPEDIYSKNKVRSLCYQIACDIHPICNLRVLKYVANTLEQGEKGKLAWIHQWITAGFNALERQVGDTFAYGGKLSMADVLIVPQVYNALRFNIDMEDYPNIMSIHSHCSQLEAFQQAHPDNQAAFN